jgi:hypothetical protein
MGRQSNSVMRCWHFAKRRFLDRCECNETSFEWWFCQMQPAHPFYFLVSFHNSWPSANNLQFTVNTGYHYRHSVITTKWTDWCSDKAWNLYSKDKGSILSRSTGYRDQPYYILLILFRGLLYLGHIAFLHISYMRTIQCHFRISLNVIS